MKPVLDYIKESWKIFVENLNEISQGYAGALALVFLFAVFIIFYNITKGFKSKKDND
jgi:hypothetical protein